MTDRKKDEKYQAYIKKLDKQLYDVEEKLGLLKKDFDELSRQAKKQVDKNANEVEEKVQSIQGELKSRAKEQREKIQKNYHDTMLYIKGKAGKQPTDLEMLKHRMKKIEHKLNKNIIHQKREEKNINEN